MSPILLDTSAYSYFKLGHDATVREMQIAPQIYMSATVLGELRAGFASGSRVERNESELNAFLSSPRVEVLPVDESTSVCYAAIHSSLRSAGTPIPSNDLWIAATAMQHGLHLLTADDHFSRVQQILVKRVG